MATERDTSTPTPLPTVAGLEVIEKIASGGHGTVYCARQQDHDRLVALKVLDTRLFDDGNLRRFERERVALGRLSDHPAIISLLDSGYTDQGAPYLLLEHAAGGSLADHVEASGPMSIDDATALAVDLASALERAHGAGIIHRDIKPANILRSTYGDWMLTDFGIASLVDRRATSTVHVSYGHTAPETFAGAAPDPVADVYSLASVVATCLSGDQPFEVTAQETPVSAMRRAATDAYPDLRDAGVPDALAALLERALSKDPLDRPASALAFAAEINQVRSDAGMMPVPIRTIEANDTGSTVVVDPASLAARWDGDWSADAPADPAPPAPKPRRLRRVLAAVALCLALAGVGAFALQQTDAVVGDAVAVQVIDAEQEIAAANPADRASGPDDAAAGQATAAALPADGEDAADVDDGGAGDGNGPGNGNGNGNGQGNGDGNGNGNGPGNGNGNGPGNGDGNGNGGGGGGGGGGNGGNGNGNGGNGPGNG